MKEGLRLWCGCVSGSGSERGPEIVVCLWSSGRASHFTSPSKNDTAGVCVCECLCGCNFVGVMLFARRAKPNFEGPIPGYPEKSQVPEESGSGTPA